MRRPGRWTMRKSITHQSLLHPDLATPLAIVDEINRRMIQAQAICRLAGAAAESNCTVGIPEIMRDAMWAVECLLGDAGELVDRLWKEGDKAVDVAGAELPKQIKAAAEAEVRAGGAGHG